MAHYRNLPVWKAAMELPMQARELLRAQPRLLHRTLTAVWYPALSASSSFLFILPTHR